MTTPNEEIDKQFEEYKERQEQMSFRQSSLLEGLGLLSYDLLPEPYEDFSVSWKTDRHGFVFGQVFWLKGPWTTSLTCTVKSHVDGTGMQCLIDKIESVFPGGKFKSWQEMAGPKLVKLNFEDGKFDATMKHEAFSALAEMFAEIFVQSKATNYTTTEAKLRLRDSQLSIDLQGQVEEKDGIVLLPLTITVQHRWGKSPHKLRLEALEKLEQVLALVPKEEQAKNEYIQAKKLLEENKKTLNPE